jgi:hypothetical protein
VLEIRNRIECGLELEFNSSISYSSCYDRIYNALNLAHSLSTPRKNNHGRNILKTIYPDGSTNFEIVLYARDYFKRDNWTKLKKLVSCIETFKHEYDLNFNNSSCHHTFILNGLAQKDDNNSDNYNDYKRIVFNMLKIFREFYCLLWFVSYTNTLRDLGFAKMMKRADKIVFSDITKDNSRGVIDCNCHNSDSNYPFFVAKEFVDKRRDLHCLGIEYRLPYPLMKKNIMKWRKIDLPLYLDLIRISALHRYDKTNYVVDETFFNETMKFYEFIYSRAHSPNFLNKGLFMNKDYFEKSIKIFDNFLKENNCDDVLRKNVFDYIVFKFEKLAGVKLCAV